MSEKSGLIPTTTVIYKDAYNLKDNVVGKYLSLEGSKDFYGTGIGLIQSTPDNVIVVTNGIEKTFTSKVNGGYNLYRDKNSFNSVYFPLPIGTPIINEINGVKPSNLDMLDVVPSPIFKLEEAGDYKITLILDLDVTIQGTYTYGQTSPSFISGALQFYAGANSTDYIYNRVFSASPQYNSSGSNPNPKAVISIKSDPIILEKSYKFGDEIFLYAKTSLGGVGLPVTYGFTVNSISFKLEKKLNTTSTSTGSFSNSLNIKEFNVSKLKLYGANRDTLILSGNKLISK